MQRAIAIVLFILGLVSCAAIVSTLRQWWDAVRWLCISAVCCFIEYLLVSAVLFWVDGFTIIGTLIAQALLNAGVLAAIWIFADGKRSLFQGISWNLEDDRIPIALAVVALLLSAGHFGYFGMGQDEGVYQTKAIDLMNGYTKRVYRFEETEKLETQEQKDLFLNATRNDLVGLYSADSHEIRGEALKLPPVFVQDISDKAQDNEAIYHGLPTYPALLALFGVLGGSYARMMDAQTVFYILSILLLWFASVNLGLKRGACAFVCLLFMLSPQMVWLSKSSLTEMTLALIMCMFLYLITENTYKERRWWAAFMVSAFSCVHISIYVMYPLFLGLFVLLFFLSGERQYVFGAICSSASYLVGMVFMTLSSTFYLVFNLLPIAVGPITEGTAWYVAMGMGVAGLLLSLALLLCRPAERRAWQANHKGVDKAFRVVVALLALWPVVNLLRRLPEAGLNQALTTNGLYVFIWMTGIISIPLSIRWLLRRGCRALKGEPVAAVAFMFLYSVLLMAGLFKPHIAYAYYYSRYLGPYIPVACVMAGLSVKRMSAKKMCAGITISALAMIPFDIALVTGMDDTFISFNALERVTDAVAGEDAIAVFSNESPDLLRQLFLPTRATGTPCYIQEDDLQAQLRRLAKESDVLYFIGRDNTPAVPSERLFIRLRETTYMDDNVSNRLPYCPLPFKFGAFSSGFSVFKYQLKREYLPWELGNTGRIENSRITLGQGELQYGPHIRLPAGNYSVEVTGENLLNSVFYATSDVGANQIPTQPLVHEDDRVVYRFNLDSLTENVEFLVRNDRGGTVYVDRVVLNDLTLKEQASGI